MSWYNQDSNTSRGNWEKEDRNVETIWNEDLPTEEDTPKREEVLTTPSSTESRSCKESGEAARTEFQSKRDKWKSFHEHSPDTPTIEKFKGRPRGAKASFWENKIESVGDVREVTSSASRLKEMKEEILRSRKPWKASVDFNTAIGDTEGETPTIEEVKCRPRGARASFWENKICSMETESETVDHRREIAHKQKMEEEILRFRRPLREVMRAVGVTDEVVQTSGQQPSETSDSSSDEEKSLSDSSSSDEEYYARIEEQKRQAKLKKELSDDEMDETIITELENLDIRDFPKKPDDSKKSYQQQALSDSSDDEEYYARIDELKRQAKLKKELSDDEMDETIITELENLDIRDFPKKPDDSKQSYQQQALSDSSDDEEYYARIEELKRQAKLKKELSDDEMDETIITELENLDIREFPKKPDDSKKSDDAEKRNNSQSRATVTEKKPAPQKSEEVAEHTTRVEIYKVTEKSPAEVLPGTVEYTPKQSADIDEKTPCEVPEIVEQKSDAEQSLEIDEPKAPAKDNQAITDMSSPEQSADTDEQNTTPEVIKATEKKPALVQSEEIAGQKIPAEVIQATEKKLTPGLSAEIAEQRTSVEVLQTTERNSAPLKSSEMAERKTLAEVPKASAKQSAHEQSADKVEQKVPAEVTQVKAKKSASEQFTEIAERETPIEVSKVTEKSASVQYVNIPEKRILANVPQSTEKKSASLKSTETLEQKRPTEVPKATEVSNLEEMESRILNSSGNNTEMKDSETVSSVSKCPAVLNECFAQSKSDLIQTVIDGTRDDGNLGKGVGNIAELVNLTNKENEAHGNPTESSSWVDCENVELDISVAQSDAPNSKSEHTASVEIDTDDLKVRGLNCIIQEELQKEVITHSESISQVCYTQPEEDIEVFYDAVSAVEGKDTHNQEKVELGEKHLTILAKTQHQENFQNEEVTEVSRWKRVLKKVGLAAIVTSCAVGGLYLLCKQADSDTFKCLWNTMSKVLPYVEPIPEPVPEKSFLWKLFDYFMPPPPPPPPERFILWELFDNLPSLF